MTPPRLNELRCPSCKQTSWVIDSDYKSEDGRLVPYSQRVYPCSRCGNAGDGWKLIQQSPAEFLLQPSRNYPMTLANFDHWVAILLANFPDHPMLAKLGRHSFLHALDDPRLAELGRHSILNTSDDPRLAELGRRFFPNTLDAENAKLREWFHRMDAANAKLWE